MVGETLRIGDTSTILGMYRLLAGLRCIASWVHIHFRNWFVELLEDALEPAEQDL